MILMALLSKKKLILVAQLSSTPIITYITIKRDKSLDLLLLIAGYLFKNPRYSRIFFPTAWLSTMGPSIASRTVFQVISVGIVSNKFSIILISLTLLSMLLGRRSPKTLVLTFNAVPISSHLCAISISRVISSFFCGSLLTSIK